MEYSILFAPPFQSSSVRFAEQKALYICRGFVPQHMRFLRGNFHFFSLKYQNNFKISIGLMRCKAKAKATKSTDRSVKQNRPFAGSSHMVRNKLHWDANNAVGLPKHYSYQSSPTFICFESPTALFASQCNLFHTMWPDPAKGLLIFDFLAA